MTPYRLKTSMEDEITGLSAPAPGGRGRIVRTLVVEDSPTMRVLLTSALEQAEGIRVVGCATNGRQAVEMTENLFPDIITMDVIMPDMDGLEATRQIMRHRPTPIVIVTAHAQSKQMNVAFEAMKAGALDVIAKPSDMNELDVDRWGRNLACKLRSLADTRPQPIASLAGQSEKSPAAPARFQDNAPTPDAPAGRILIVEDSATQAEALYHNLKKHNFLVAHARDGRRGLDMAKEKKPDLIITDWQMPNMDGHEMCRELKADPALAQTPIILLTSSDDEAACVRSLASGAVRFMRKPYDFEKLLSQIRYLLHVRVNGGGASVYP